MQSIFQVMSLHPSPFSLILIMPSCSSHILLACMYVCTYCITSQVNTTQYLAPILQAPSHCNVRSLQIYRSFYQTPFNQHEILQRLKTAWFSNFMLKSCSKTASKTIVTENLLHCKTSSHRCSKNQPRQRPKSRAMPNFYGNCICTLLAPMAVEFSSAVPVLYIVHWM